MAKEALFNILNNHFDFERIRVLDIFAGTGNISLEFASRGAVEVIAVDIHRGCVDFIREGAVALQFDSLTVLRTDAFRFLSQCRTSFDVIFADPPFDMDNIRRIPDLVFQNKLLERDGFLILEHHGQLLFDDHPGFYEKRKYGKVNFSFFRHSESGSL